MLDLMRKHATSWIIKVALGGIIVVFVFWYGWSGPTEKSRDFVAKVNDDVITYDQYRNAYEAELEKIRMRFKGGIPSELMEKLNLKKNVLQAMIDRQLLLQEAKKLGLTVTDQDLIDDLKYNPMFQRDGAFDENIYRVYLSSLKLSPIAFERERKQELLEQQLADLLTDSPKTNPEEIKRFWHFQNDKLHLANLLLKTTEKADVMNIDPKALDTFFKENAQKYEIPASVDVEYVSVTWRDSAKNISISEDEVKSYYDSNPKEFTEPETVRLRNILLKSPEGQDKEETKKRAEEIRARINTAEDFAALATAESQDSATAEKGGDMGFISLKNLDQKLEKAAEKLQIGVVSEPVETSQGIHLLFIEERKPERSVPFDEVKGRISDKLIEERARKKVNDDADAFYEKVYRAWDLREPSKQFGLEVNKVESVTKSSGLPGILDPKLSEEAFTIRPGDISKLMRSGENYVVMKVTEKKPERIPTLDEVQSLVQSDFVKNRENIALQKRASEIIQELKQPGADPEAIAAKYNLSWDMMEPVSRTAGFLPKLGSGPQISELLSVLSEATPIFASPVTTSDGTAIVRLVKIDPAPESQFEDAFPA